MWAALNPGVWVTPGIAEDGGSYNTPPGAPIDDGTGTQELISDMIDF